MQAMAAKAPVRGARTIRSDRRSRRIGRLAPGLTLAALTALGACRSGQQRDSEFERLPGLHVEEVLAPSRGNTARRMLVLERALGRRSRLSRETRWATRLRLAELARRSGRLRSAERHLSKAASQRPNARATAIAALVQARIEMTRKRKPAALAALARADQYAMDAATRTRSARMRREIEGPKPIAAAPTPSRISVVRRGSWGSAAAVPSRMVAMERPRRITIHHSALFCGRSPQNCNAILRSIQRTHIQQRGWGDIGYHFLIDPRGRVLEGRQLKYQGAHAGGPQVNRGNIGICLLGNFQPGTRERVQRPSIAQLQALETLVSTLSARFNVAPASILSHREVHPRGPGATECPGRFLSPYVSRLRQQQRLARRGAAAHRPLANDE